MHGLAQVFRTKYNFKVDVKEMHNDIHPQTQAFKHVSDFVYDEDGDRSLLIVYYAGHGWSEAANENSIKLSG